MLAVVEDVDDLRCAIMAVDQDFRWRCSNFRKRKVHGKSKAWPISGVALNIAER